MAQVSPILTEARSSKARLFSHNGHSKVMPIQPIARTGMEDFDSEFLFKKNLDLKKDLSSQVNERTSLFSVTDQARVANINASRLRAEKLWGFPKPLVQTECAFMSSLAAQMVSSSIFLAIINSSDMVLFA